MGGYSKINKDKIQPSPALAAITGLLIGLNAHKKELQDREDKGNKADMELGKWLREFGIKEREADIKERTVANAEQSTEDEWNYKSSLLNNATEEQNIRVSQEARAKEKWLLEKVPLEAQGKPDHPFNVGIQEIKKRELWDIALNDLRKQEKLDELKYGKEYVGTGSYIAEQEIQLNRRLEELGVEQTGREKIVGIEQAGQNRRNRENNARMASEGEKNRANAITLKGMDTGTESNDPAIRNFLSIQKANEGFFGTVMTSPTRIIDDLTAKYMGDRSRAEVDAYNELTPEQKKDVKAPTPVGMSKQEKGGWKVFGIQTKIGANPTKMLVGSDIINFRQFTTQGAKNSLKSEHPNKKDALKYLLDRGVSETAAQSIIDEVYKK